MSDDGKRKLDEMIAEAFTRMASRCPLPRESFPLLTLIAIERVAELEARIERLEKEREQR